MPFGKLFPKNLALWGTLVFFFLSLIEKQNKTKQNVLIDISWKYVNAMLI